VKYSNSGINMKIKSHTDLNLIPLQTDFYSRDVLEVAPELIGKILIVSPQGVHERRFMITEAEAYRGIDDKACHASKGRTSRTEIMFHEGGKIYVYFVYGMYWMLNIVTGKKDDPQAVLIRGVEGVSGPGRVTRELGIDGSFYGEDLIISERIRIADPGKEVTYFNSPRIGIGYSGEPWKSKKWRYILKEKTRST
jgi:DNA-3-methyladenine glycosylase